MNSGGNPIWTLISTFALMSLFAVGGGNAAIPEMHRIAVDVQHWMTDKQFADVFAISQLSPGPNVLIVTLIGYSVAGVAGALAATLSMCVPTAVLAYYVSRFLSRSSHSRWPAIIQAALVPLSIGPRLQRSWPSRPGSIRSGYCWPGAAWVLLALSDENR
jgi:chromate transporter